MRDCLIHRDTSCKPNLPGFLWSPSHSDTRKWLTCGDIMKCWQRFSLSLPRVVWISLSLMLDNVPKVTLLMVKTRTNSVTVSRALASLWQESLFETHNMHDAQRCAAMHSTLDTSLFFCTFLQLLPGTFGPSNPSDVASILSNYTTSSITRSSLCALPLASVVQLQSSPPGSPSGGSHNIWNCK